MTLGEAVRQLRKLDEDAFLCVRRPWTSASECVVVIPDESLTVPKHVKDAGFVYFLGVHHAGELLDGLGDKPCYTDEHKVSFLIHYAENDAYPDWANQGVAPPEASPGSSAPGKGETGGDEAQKGPKDGSDAEG